MNALAWGKVPLRIERLSHQMSAIFLLSSFFYSLFPPFYLDSAVLDEGIVDDFLHGKIVVWIDLKESAYHARGLG